MALNRLDCDTRHFDGDTPRRRADLIVLGYDPTGTQTVHDIAVLTRWGVEALTAELRDPAPLLYILTNSRSLPINYAAALIESIMANLHAALQAELRSVDVISRGDSTLRVGQARPGLAQRRGQPVAGDDICSICG